MKEQMRTKMEQVTRKIYIADDGTEFTDRAECVKYEQEIYQPLADAVDELRIDKLSGVSPITVDDEDGKYEWYKVDNEEQMELLCKFYQDNSLGTYFLLPDIICIRDCLDYGYVEDFSLRYIMKHTQNFWKRFDYLITFQKDEK